MKTKSLLDSCAYLAMACLVIACRNAVVAEAHPTEEATEASAADDDDSELMNNTRVAVSHILMTHAESEEFPSAMMRPPLISNRTKKQAIAMTRELAIKVKARPRRFGQLAKRYSEDIYSAPYGGSLGVTNLASFPEEVAEALSKMKDGEISDAVESVVGIHVLYRQPLPKDAILSARSLVVSYAGSPDVASDEDHAKPTRSREEARKLAEKYLRQIRRDPANFENFIRKHSEGLRASDGGHLGQWSYANGRRLPCLSVPLVGLKVGQLSGVVETPYGFQIFQRLAPGKLDVRAASAIVIAKYKEGRTLEESKALATSVREELAKSPARFAEMFEHYSDFKPYPTSRVPDWSRGDQQTQLDVAISALPIGGISDVLAIQNRLIILRREEPITESPRAER